jgi:Zn ribbon nucleic-acid-binding protein
MATTYSYTNTLTVVECCACHIDFAMPDELYQRRRRDHQSFWCPAGHKQYFSGKSDLEAERARTQAAEDLATKRLAQLDRERAALEAERDRHQHTERRLRSTKAVVTKTKKRIAAGKCPRCSMRFEDLAGHMAHDHPEYGGQP